MGVVKRTIAALLVVFLLLAPVPVLATEPEQEQRVFDDAGLFTEGEAAELEQKIAAAREKTEMDIVIVTTSDARGKTARDYADDYYDENGFGAGDDNSGVLLLIDMDNRELYISTCGMMIRYLTDARIESMLDHVYEGAAAEDFAASGRAFVADTALYVGLGVVSGQYNYNEETGSEDAYEPQQEPQSSSESEEAVPPSKSEAPPASSTGWDNFVRQLPLYVMIALGTGVGVCLAVRSNYKMKNKRYWYPYREKASFYLTQQSDRLVSRDITSRYVGETTTKAASSGAKSSSASSSARSTTHTSSSGVTHGGGGRKF